MRTVAMLSQKGGAGKTTLALNLAVAADRQGIQTAVVDLDPQVSASGWCDLREERHPAVVATPAARLPHVLATARSSGVRLAILDTAPHAEAPALAAARAADLIIIPCRPSILDLRAIAASVDLVRLADRPGVILLNACPTRGSVAEEAARAVASYNLKVAPVRIGQRAAFSHALAAGLTVQEYDSTSKAAAEIAALFAWLQKVVHMSTRPQEDTYAEAGSRGRP